MFPAVSLEVSVVVVEVYWIEFFASFMAVPERYDMKPGSIGRIHGDRKEAKPAPAETRTLVSNTILSHTNLCQQSINSYFQITSKSIFVIITRLGRKSRRHLLVNLEGRSGSQQIRSLGSDLERPNFTDPVYTTMFYN